MITSDNALMMTGGGRWPDHETCNIIDCQSCAYKTLRLYRSVSATIIEALCVLWQSEIRERREC